MDALVKKPKNGTSLVVQWLRLRASSAGAVGSIPGRGTKIQRAKHKIQNKKKKKRKPKNNSKGPQASAQ